MATPKEQAQAEVYRMQADVQTAQGQVDLRKSQLAADKDNPRAKGNLATAETALKNAVRALGLAKDALRRF